MSSTPTAKSWQWGSRTLVQHTISLVDPVDPSRAKTTISCLIQPSLLDSLPNPLPTAHPQAHPNCDPSTSELPCRYAVRLTAYKGLGMFATDDIPAGSLIAIEHPALIVPCLPWGALPKEAYDSLAEKDDQGREPLTPERKEVLKKMANSHLRPEDGLKGPCALGDSEDSWCESYVEGVIRTNADLLQLPAGAKKTRTRQDQDEEPIVYGGVYPLVSRCNHSCGPNAAVKWNNATLAGSLYALRDIKAGEEIFKTYVDPTLPRSKRMETLQQNHRFKCDCNWCSPTPAPDSDSITNDRARSSTARSDTNRAAIRDWLFTHPSYSKWSTDLCRSDTIVTDSHLEALDIIAQEGLHGFQVLFVEEIAMCYAMLGDEEAFGVWGRRVVQLSQVEDPPLAKKFEEWLEDPVNRVKRWGWRLKERQRVSRRKDTRDVMAFLEEDSILLSVCA